ncbi:MAG: hypothetical protein NTZ18_05005 [Candidatus Komeilibacteria bacterium]|nr:hypothetical protein [Candidatus Komeilibacteria bacterium]
MFKLEIELKSLTSFTKTFASKEECANIDELINYAGEYGHGFGIILGVINDHKHPIPQSIYDQIIRVGQFFEDASKKLKYRDVTPDMWEDLQPLVISDEKYKAGVMSGKIKVNQNKSNDY